MINRIVVIIFAIISSAHGMGNELTEERTLKILGQLENLVTRHAEFLWPHPKFNDHAAMVKQTFKAKYWQSVKNCLSTNKSHQIDTLLSSVLSDKEFNKQFKEIVGNESLFAQIQQMRRRLLIVQTTQTLMTYDYVPLHDAIQKYLKKNPEINLLYSLLQVHNS
jgi:hypothetical protein